MPIHAGDADAAAGMSSSSSATPAAVSTASQQPSRTGLVEIARKDPLADRLEADAFQPSVVTPPRTSATEQNGEVVTPSILSSSASRADVTASPSSAAPPLGLTERYLLSHASDQVFSQETDMQRTRSEEAVFLSSDAITEQLPHLTRSGPYLARSASVQAPRACVDTSRAPFLVEPVFIQSSTVKLLLKRLSNDVTALQDAQRQEVAMRVLQDSSPELSPKSVSESAMDASRSSSLHMPYHTSVPQRLDLPLKERCSFCQKHDSMCSRCHAKWTAIQKDIRETRVRPAYFSLPQERRVALAFLTAAFGSGDFLAAQAYHDAALIGQVQSRYVAVSVGETWHAAVAAPHVMRSVSMGDVHDRQLHRVEEARVLMWLVDTFRRAGAVHVLHVALAHRNTGTTKVLLANAALHFLASENGLDPLAFLACPVGHGASLRVPPGLLHVLDSSRECRQHIRSELAKTALKQQRYTEARPLLDDILRDDPDDERGLWFSALLDYAEKNYAASQHQLKRLLQTASKRPLFFLDTSQIHRLLANVTRDSQASHKRVALNQLTTPFSVRRLPFSIVRDGLLPFLSPLNLLRVYEASRIPLLRSTAEAIAAKAMPRLLQPVLTVDATHYSQLVLELMEELPQTEPVGADTEVPDWDTAVTPDSLSREERDAGVTIAVPNHTNATELPCAAVKDGTLRPMTVNVLSMTTFCTLVIKLSMAGQRSRAFTAFLRAHDTGTSLFDQLVGQLNPVNTYLYANEIVLSRVFTVQRSDIGHPWHVTPYTHWDLDLAATVLLATT